MRIGIIGSRSITDLNLEPYLPNPITQIVSGGARGVDTIAGEYAREHGIPLLEFLPEYQKYGRAAPLKRDLLIIDNSDIMIAFWDGSSKGTAFSVEQCRKAGLEVIVYVRNEKGEYEILP